MFFLDEVTDSEIKEWAAKTIQTSFREYKRRQNWVKVQHANTFIQVTKKASLKKKTSSTSVQFETNIVVNFCSSTNQAFSGFYLLHHIVFA